MEQLMFDMCQLLCPLVQCSFEFYFTGPRATRAQQITGAHQQSREKRERKCHGRAILD
jgi:hypothetical protein